MPLQPEDFITYLPSHIGTMQPIQYHSCFISDCSQDEEFARRRHEKMRGKKQWGLVRSGRHARRLYVAVIPLDFSVALLERIRHERILARVAECDVEAAGLRFGD